MTFGQRNLPLRVLITGATPNHSSTLSSASETHKGHCSHRQSAKRKSANGQDNARPQRERKKRSREKKKEEGEEAQTQQGQSLSSSDWAHVIKLNNVRIAKVPSQEDSPEKVGMLRSE